jgi:hypothetical protein
MFIILLYSEYSQNKCWTSFNQGRTGFFILDVKKAHKKSKLLSTIIYWIWLR